MGVSSATSFYLEFPPIGASGQNPVTDGREPTCRQQHPSCSVVFGVIFSDFILSFALFGRRVVRAVVCGVPSSIQCRQIPVLV